MNLEKAERCEHVFDCYCKKVLRNRAITLHRRLDRIQAREVDFSNLSEEGYTLEPAPPSVWHFSVGEAEITVRDELLAKALSALPPQKRDVLLLSYFMDWSNREIARRFSLTESAVTARRSRALDRLRKELEAIDRA